MAKLALGRRGSVNIQSSEGCVSQRVFMAAWVRNLNRGLGLTPSSLAVALHFDETLMQAPEDVWMLKGRRNRGEAANRQWAYEWRLRWQGKFGNLECNDVDSVDVLRNKAILWVPEFV